MPKKRILVRVEGRVQGVFFRDYTEREARRLNLSGWVRNLPDGSVQAEVEGDDAVLAAMVQWFHTGSPTADVRAVHVTDIPVQNGFGFSVRYP